MAKSIEQITKIIDKFVDERDWAVTDPNHLISSILIELGELSEHYQWMHEFPEMSKDKKTEIGYEFVDVMFYLFRLASQSDIDLERYFDEKMVKLEKKFPKELTEDERRKRHDDYRKTGKNKLY